MGFLDDPELAAYVNELGKKLARYAPPRNFDYEFRIVDDASPNAFALPGGYIFISRGLLILSNSEDELANVIGHEIIHVAARHASARQTFISSFRGPSSSSPSAALPPTDGTRSARPTARDRTWPQRRATTRRGWRTSSRISSTRSACSSAGLACRTSSTRTPSPASARPRPARAHGSQSGSDNPGSPGIAPTTCDAWRDWPSGCPARRASSRMSASCTPT